MKDAPTPFAFDITNLPKTVEQQTLATLERIEKLITDFMARPQYWDHIADVVTKTSPTKQGTKKR